jgi:hypothetical protein
VPTLSQGSAHAEPRLQVGFGRPSHRSLHHRTARKVIGDRGPGRLGTILSEEFRSWDPLCDVASREVEKLEFVFIAPAFTAQSHRQGRGSNLSRIYLRIEDDVAFLEKEGTCNISQYTTPHSLPPEAHNVPCRSNTASSLFMWREPQGELSLSDSMLQAVHLA